MEKSKKRTPSVTKEAVSSKRLRKTNDNSSTSKESASSDSDSSATNSKDRYMDPWDVPINSKTKDLCFMPVDPAGANHMAKLNAFSELKQLDKLKCIVIDFTHIIEDNNEQQDKEIAKILNRILVAGAQNLEEIILRSPIGYIPGLVFPVMKKVTKLQLLFYWWGTDACTFTGCLRGGEIFPKRFKFAVLPNLKEVVINLETEGGNPQNYTRFDCWQNNLKSCGIAKKVTNIEYADDCGFSKQRLRITFPNAIWSDSSNLNVTYESSTEEDSDEDLEVESESEDE